MARAFHNDPTPGSIRCGRCGEMPQEHTACDVTGTLLCPASFVELEDENATLAHAASQVRAHVDACPLGYVHGKLISLRSTSDAEVIEWLQKLKELVTP